MLLEHTYVMQFYGTNVFVKYIHLFMSGYLLYCSARILRVHSKVMHILHWLNWRWYLCPDHGLENQEVLELNLYFC